MKLGEKKKKEDEEKAKKLQEEEEMCEKKKESKEKFKEFHQVQLTKIKKTFEETNQNKKKMVEDTQQESEKREELMQKLRSKNAHEDKKIMEAKKESEEKIQQLFESEAIQATLRKYAPNLRGLFDFLIKNTYLSLTERRHNNEVIYESWRLFNIAFELSPLIINAKEIVSVFKALTKDKIVPKEYVPGLKYEEFLQAVFRIVVKYKTIFNILADKIKDKEQEPPAKQELPQKAQEPKTETPAAGQKIGKKG